MTYEAIICRITNVRKHPNADRIQLANAQGCQVVVGLDVREGDLGVFFPIDGQLSVEYATANDLVAGVDSEGNRTGGFFDKQRRVRVQNFRGEKSEGYWASVSSLMFLGYVDVFTTYNMSYATTPTFREGDRFTEISGVPICNKYYTPATLARKAGGQGKLAKANKFFAKHVDTEQLRHRIDEVPDGSVIYLTTKLHGSSHRVGRVLEKSALSQTRLQRLLRRPVKHTEEYTVLNGTRNVVLSDVAANSGYYGSDEFRYNAVRDWSDHLHDGEVVYGEIVGYTTSGQSIMGSHKTDSLKAIKKQYGPSITYKYGQLEGTCKFYAYRITKVGPDGNVVELTWPQVKQRCKSLGVSCVPDEVGSPFIYDSSQRDTLIKDLTELVERPSVLDSSHIEEGVCLRVEQSDGKINFFKHKSYTFGVLEGFIKCDESYVDTEEVS